MAPMIEKLLQRAIDEGASDLHITEGVPPTIRVHGRTKSLDGLEPLTQDVLEHLLQPLGGEHWEHFLEVGEADFAYGVAGLGRFRCNLFKQRGSMGVAIRVINAEIKPFADLGLPDVLEEICQKRDGLVLVTGPTGSGKTTTLAAMIDLINSTRSGVIITMEDPIEYLHTHKRCIVNQREVGSDTRSFANGLRAALRADPDVVLVGEMRDLETIETAITAAETGHLVFSTLHTRGAAQTVDRVIDAFPQESQQQIRTQLASVLAGVISQQLVTTVDGKGMVPAVEVMLGTPAVRNMIRDGKTHQIPSVIETGARFGMQSLERALTDLVQKGLIDPQEAELRKQK